MLAKLMLAWKIASMCHQKVDEIVTPIHHPSESYKSGSNLRCWCRSIRLCYSSSWSLVQAASDWLHTVYPLDFHPHLLPQYPKCLLRPALQYFLAAGSHFEAHTFSRFKVQTVSRVKTWSQSDCCCLDLRRPDIYCQWSETSPQPILPSHISKLNMPQGWAIYMHALWLVKCRDIGTLPN